MQSAQVRAALQSVQAAVSLTTRRAHRLAAMSFGMQVARTPHHAQPGSSVQDTQDDCAPQAPRAGHSAWMAPGEGVGAGGASGAGVGSAGIHPAQHAPSAGCCVVPFVWKQVSVPLHQPQPGAARHTLHPDNENKLQGLGFPHSDMACVVLEKGTGGAQPPWHPVSFQAGPYKSPVMQGDVRGSVPRQ